MWISRNGRERGADWKRAWLCASFANLRKCVCGVRGIELGCARVWQEVEQGVDLPITKHLKAIMDVRLASCCAEGGG